MTLDDRYDAFDEAAYHLYEAYNALLLLDDDYAQFADEIRDIHSEVKAGLRDVIDVMTERDEREREEADIAYYRDRI